MTEEFSVYAPEMTRPRAETVLSCPFTRDPVHPNPPGVSTARFPPHGEPSLCLLGTHFTASELEAYAFWLRWNQAQAFPR